MAPDSQNKLKHAVEMIQEKIPSLIALILFGSYGTLYETPHSDLDLAVLAQSKIDTVALWNLSQEVAIAINRDVDLVDLRQASTIFQCEIFSTGNNIFCADENALIFFENMVFSMYIHLQELRQEILDP
jgi:predicted nucleotidyltransferase